MNPFTWTITADYQDGQQEGQPRYVLDDGMQTRTYGTVEAACAEVVECANLYADLDLCLAERRTTGVFMIGVDIQTVDDAGIEMVVEDAIGPVMNALAGAGWWRNRVDVRFTSNGDVLHVDPSWLSTCS